MSFVHLHTHSEYSLLQSPLFIKDLVSRCKEYGMPSVALTDYGNMFGAIEFYLLAKEYEIKPILGMEVYRAVHGRYKKQNEYRKTNHLVLLAQNYKGYQNLCQISSLGYQEGFYYVPRIDDEILKKYNKNIIALSGSLKGDVADTFFEKGKEACEQRIKWYKKVYEDRFYLEMTLNLPECHQFNEFLYDNSKKLDIPLVATNNVHYLNQDEQIAQEVLVCIGSNKTLQDETRYRLGSDQFYFKSSEEMKELFRQYPEALSNTLEIADRCNIEFVLKDKKGHPIYHLPSYSKKKDSIKELRELTIKGLKAKNIPKLKQNVYYQRIEKEIQIIGEMGFAGYFLIVQDFVNWSKNNGVPVGPGRGSGAGSLVAYCLGITALDPLPLGLIFERFLNPERISLPDFDIDFCQENRHKVLSYVEQKYSKENVSHIITYGRLQARAALRDVGRVLGMTYDRVDNVAKLIPDVLKITLSESIKKEPRLKTMIDEDSSIERLFELAKKIEGVVRHASIHAAGVIIADGNIVSHAPLYKGAEGDNVIQYDMKSAEKIGLVKFDFLGLKTLTHIHESLNLIHNNNKKPLSIDNIDIFDKGIYELLSKGDTAGVFQFEGQGVTEVIKKVKPESFKDIMAINALYRPGPMEKIPDYIERKKHPEKISYIFEELEDILKETLGVIVYQEQVQFIAAKIANYSLGEADILRKAMGKKETQKMAKQKERFLKGARKNKYDEKKSSQLFDTMAEFAKYGFNKSHAAAYCVLSAQTAYLKKNYPEEFYAALFSTEMNDTEKLSFYIKDAHKRGLEIKPPHINHSDYKFTVKQEMIFFSLGAIKGVGQSAVEAILEARKNILRGFFESLEQFFENVDLRRVNKKTIESLIKAGALDGFSYHRHQLLKHFDIFVKRAEKQKEEKEIGQTSLFSLHESFKEEQTVKIKDCEKWTTQIQLAYEKEVLGLYLTGHPLQVWKRFVTQQKWGALFTSDLKSLKNEDNVILVGLVGHKKEFFTKKGKRMAFVRLENLDGFIELVVFSDCYNEYEFLLKSQIPLVVYGKIGKEKNKVIVDKIESVLDKMNQTRKVVFNIKEDDKINKAQKMKELQKLFIQYKGQTPLGLRVHLKKLSQKVDFNFEGSLKVKPSIELFESFYNIMGKSSHVEIL